MNKVLLLALLATIFSGCARLDVMAKRQESSLNGLDRTIIQYSYDGKELNRLNGKFVVNVDSGDVCIRAFNVTTQKVYLITPPFIVIEN